MGSPSDAVYTRYYGKELEYWQNPPHGDENTVHGSEEHPKRAASLRQVLEPPAHRLDRKESRPEGR